MGITIIALIALDQLTKHLAQVHLAPVREVVLIEGILSLFFHTNKGMAFGLLQGGRIFFIISTIIVLILIAYNYFTLPKTRIYNFIRIMLAVLVAGALGNFIDRVRQGYVVDFIFIRAINFPIFNVADILIVVSSLSIGVVAFIMMAREAKSKKTEKVKDE